MTLDTPGPELRAGPRPLDSRRRRLRELLSRVSPIVGQFYRDGCKLADGDVVLEAGTHVLGLAAREMESSIRAVLLAVFVRPSAEQQHSCGFDETEGTHRQEIIAITAALGLPAEIASEVADRWVWLATGRGRGPGREQRGFAGWIHRRNLEVAAPVSARERQNWRELEDVMTIVLRPLEDRFAELLPRFRALAARPLPTRADLDEMRDLPNTYPTRAEFFDNAGGAWLSLLDGAGLFDQAGDAFRLDTATDEVLPQRWLAGEYLARVGVLPEHQTAFAVIIERIDIPHEQAALSLIKAARQLQPAPGGRCARRFARWVVERERLDFVGLELAALAAERAAVPESAAAGRELLETLLELRPESSDREGAADG